MDTMLAWPVWLLAIALLVLVHVLGVLRPRREADSMRNAQRGYGVIAGIIINVIVSVAISVAAFALTKIKGAKSSRPQIPTNREGARVRRIYGTVWIDDPVQCAMKFLSPEPIKQKVKGPLGIGSKKVTVGYHYHWVMHFCWCGPVDALLGMRAGDVAFITRRFDSNRRITIEEPDLWGGPEGEGGIEGPLDLWFGREGQVPSEYLIAEFGDKQPARLGKFCTTFAGGRYGAGSANPRPPSAKVCRVLTDWLDDEPWYPEKLALPITERVREKVLVQWRQSSLHSGNEDRARMGVAFLDLEGEVISTVWAPMIGTPHHVWTPRYVQASTPAGCAAVRILMEMERHEGSGNDGYIDSIVVILGTQAADLVNPGAEDGTTGWVNEVGELAVRSADPDPHAGSEAYFTGGTSALTRAHQDITPLSPAMNGAHVIYDSLTHPDMLGEPVALVNDASFRASADRLYAEGFGVCADYDEDEETIEEFQQRILNLIGGALTQSRVDGQYYLDLIRGAGEEELPVITDADVKEAVITQVQPLEAINVIRVEWFNPVTKTSRLTAPVASLSAIRSAGRQIAQTRLYKEIPFERLALRVAQRDLNSASLPLHKIDLKLLHRFRGLRQGRLVRLQLIEDGISDMVCVVGPNAQGDRLKNDQSVTLVQNAFDLPATVHVESAPEPEETSEFPAPPPQRIAVEAPYMELVDAMSPGDLAVLPEAAGFMYTAATQPGTALNYDLYTKVGDEEYAERDTADWTPSALVVEAAGKTETTFTLSNGSLLSRVVAGSWALWGEEIVRVDALNLGTLAVQFGRGCGDTVPAGHGAGERVWFMGEWAGADPRQYSDGDVVDAKLLTRASGGVLELEFAEELSLTLDQRAYRPYPPGKLLINGEAYPATYASGDLTITWAHRDRLLQKAEVVDTTQDDVGPEDGTTYSGEILDASTLAVLDSFTGEAGTTHTTLAALLASAETGIRIRLRSNRDGLESWQEHDHEMLPPSDPEEGIVFTESGTWVKPDNLDYIEVEVVGGGGGGASGGALVGVFETSVHSGGGGGGAYAKVKILASAIPGDCEVTVGAGGAGGAGGGPEGYPGANGEESSFKYDDGFGNYRINGGGGGGGEPGGNSGAYGQTEVNWNLMSTPDVEALVEESGGGQDEAPDFSASTSLGAGAGGVRTGDLVANEEWFDFVPTSPEDGAYPSQTTPAPAGVAGSPPGGNGGSAGAHGITVAPSPGGAGTAAGGGGGAGGWSWAISGSEPGAAGGPGAPGVVIVREFFLP